MFVRSVHHRPENISRPPHQSRPFVRRNRCGQFVLLLLLLFLFLLPSTSQAQALQAEVDSTSRKQFDDEVSQFLEQIESLEIETRMYWSVQKLARKNYREGKRKSPPDIYEGGGEKVLLDTYSQIAQATTLLYTLEHLGSKKEAKDKYRVLLTQYIELTSNSLLALVQMEKNLNDARRELRRQLYQKLGLPTREDRIGRR